MTTAATASRWRFFVSSPEQPRVRRAGDAVILGLGLLVLLVDAFQANRDGPLDRAVSQLVDALPAWSVDFFSIAFGVSALYAIGIIAAAAATGGRHRDLTRDLLVAAFSAAVLAAVIVRWVDGEWPVVLPELELATVRPQFPVVRVAVVTAVAAVSSPHVLRPVRRVGWALALLVMTAGIGLGLGQVSDVIGGVGLGLAVAGGVLLAFGSPAGYPDKEQVMADLAQLGLPVADLVPAARQPWGARHLAGTDVEGADVLLKVYGRDARDAQLAAKVWRFLWYRDTGPAVAMTRLQQVEHEALVTLLAERAGVATPQVLVAATAADDSAILVTEHRGVPLAEVDAAEITDGLLVELWWNVGRMHAAAIAHGALGASRVHVAGDGPVLTDFHAGSLSASSDRLGTDVAELAVALASRIGIDRTVQTAAVGLGTDSIAAALPFMQPAALSPATRRAAGKAKAAKALVKDLQSAMAEASGAELPPPAQLRRWNARDLIITALIGLAAYFLIQQLAGVDLAELWDDIKDAEVGWVLAALVVAQLLLIPNATGMMAAVTAPIPLRPTVILQSAIQFIGLAVPSTAGRVATLIAYLRKFGVPPVAATTQGALDSFTGFLVQAAILGLALAFGDLTFNADADFDLNWALILGLAAAVVVAGLLVVWFVERLRTAVVGAVREVVGSVGVLFRQPQRAVALFASNFASQIVLGAALWLAVRAFGESVGFATATVVVVGSLLLGGMAPTPGGIGVAEAVLAGGLTAAGVPQSTAFAAAIVYRLVTFFLPPIWGFFSLRWLERNDYL